MTGELEFCTCCSGYIEPRKGFGYYPCKCREETYSYRIKELEQRLNKAEMLIEALMIHTEFKKWPNG